VRHVTVLFSERVKWIGGALAGARSVTTGGAFITTVLTDRRAVVESGRRVVAGTTP
jgi:hypothetical protein